MQGDVGVRAIPPSSRGLYQLRVRCGLQLHCPAGCMRCLSHSFGGNLPTRRPTVLPRAYRQTSELRTVYENRRYDQAAKLPSGALRARFRPTTYERTTERVPRCRYDRYSRLTQVPRGPGTRSLASLSRCPRSHFRCCRCIFIILLVAVLARQRCCLRLAPTLQEASSFGMMMKERLFPVCDDV